MLAVKAIIIKDGKMLLLQRNPTLRKENNWDLPGGLLEENESEIEALQREAKEEIHSSIEIIKPSGKWTFKRTYDNKIISVHNYLCKLKDDNTKIILSDEHISFKWIEPKDIIQFKLKDDSLSKSILKEFNGG